jgi:hypothetical protein
VATSILQPFKTFSTEGEIVGRLMARYSSLEVGLMHCVEVALNYLDRVLKALFRRRSETRRIDEGERLGLPAYTALLHVEFQAAISAMRHCLEARKQYAYWIW